MNILDAIPDEQLFQPFLGEDLTSWANWMSALRCLYGLPLDRHDRLTIRECTGRKRLNRLPTEGFSEALFITGRRSGKSRTAALIGAFEALFCCHEHKLAPGERGLVAIFAPTREQSGIVHSYLRAVFNTPMLEAQVVEESRTRFQLRNGITIQIVTGDHKVMRGFTLVCAICDELAFMGVGEEARVKSDVELVRAIRPSLATTGGRLIGITSPFWKQGHVFRQWKRCWGNDSARTLVWKCPSRTMNPTLSQSVIDKAMEEDPTAARSEYMGEFREGATQFISPDLVEALVDPGVQEHVPTPGIEYTAFFDSSGGRSDSSVLAIAHAEEGQLVLDVLREWLSPMNPSTAIRQAAVVCSMFNTGTVYGDRYAADFVVRAFEAVGKQYVTSDRSKSQIYLECLPLLCSGGVQLLDNPRLVAQLSGLIRICRTGGRDTVGHAPGGHDDCANSACGALVHCALPQGGRVGVWGSPAADKADALDGDGSVFVHCVMNAIAD